MEAVEGATGHVHEEDTDFVENSSKNFRWTDEMTKYVTEGIQNNHRPNFILRKMKKSNMFDKLPSKTQLYNKCAATKKTENPSYKINNTNEMRNKVAEFLGEPTSEVKAFVPFHEILDDDDTKEPRFTVIFSTKKNLKKLKSERVLQQMRPTILSGFAFQSLLLVRVHYLYSFYSCTERILLAINSPLDYLLQ